MGYIQWNKSVKVNVPIIDKQHKNMVELTNKLHDFVETNNNTQIKKNLEFLIDDLKIHFETENKMMTDSKLPNFISHKLEHDRFYNKMNGLYLSVKTGKQKLTLEDLKSVKIWFFNHMDFKDRVLADHILANS